MGLSVVYVSHISNDGKVELVTDHLQETAELSADFAKQFGAVEWAYALGKFHDAGKYSKEFQDRIMRNGPRVDHSSAGAFELFSKGYDLLAYAIAGHHGGMPDGAGALTVSMTPPSLAG